MPLSSLILREDPYLRALETWRIAKRVTSHGPSPPPGPDLVSGSAEQQQRRLAAQIAAKLEWEAAKAEWSEANGKRKKKRRAERDSVRPPTAERQQRSDTAKQKRVALQLRTAARLKSFPFVTLATFHDINVLTRQYIDASGDATNLSKWWKRLSGNQLPERPWFGVQTYDALSGRCGEFRDRLFFLFASNTDVNAGTAWTGASLQLCLPTNLEGESTRDECIALTLRVGKHKPTTWDDGGDREHPYELERGQEYSYEVSSARHTLSSSCGIKPVTASDSALATDPAWMTDLLLNHPARYREVQRVNRKMERLRQFNVATEGRYLGLFGNYLEREPAQVSYVACGRNSSLDADYLADHWDHFGDSTASAHDDAYSASSHSSDDSDGMDKYMRSEAKERQKQRLALQKEWDAGGCF